MKNLLPPQEEHLIVWKFIGKNISTLPLVYINKINQSSDPEEILSNRQKALKMLNKSADKICLVKQIHSDKVVILNEVVDVNHEPIADAIVTNRKNLAIAVTTADCVPILLADEKKMVIGAVHAGWRGALSSLIQNTIEAMELLGAERSNIQAVIGPSIAKKSYEVTQEFYDCFIKESNKNDQFFEKKDDSHFFFDLKYYIENKLVKFIGGDIHNLNIDTYTNQNDYYSYRRHCHIKDEYGFNISIIAICFK